MYFYIIPPIYVLTHLIFFQVWNVWLSNAFASCRNSKNAHRVLFAVITLASLPSLLGCFLPENRFQSTLSAIGNIWLGFLFYAGGISLLLAIFVTLPMYVSRRRAEKNARITAPAGRTAAEHRQAEGTSGEGRQAEGVSEDRVPAGRTDADHRQVTAPSGNVVKVHRGLIIGTLAAALILNIYGIHHAVDVKVHELSVNIDKPLIIDGVQKESLKVVLIGDLHMSVNSKPRTIQRMVDLVNEQDADLVMAAGDFLTSTYIGLKDPETYAKILRQIESKYGSYAVYGNHDVEEPLLGGFPMTSIDKAYRSEEMRSFIASLGFEILEDEVVDAADGGIVLAGREDGEKTGDGLRRRLEADELMKGIDKTRPVFVLEHEPVDFENLEIAGADLVLSGHTHAGQIFPGTLVTPFFNENNYGLKKFGSLQSVVTSGVGFYGPPLRVGCDSEIMVLDIHFLQN